MPKMGLYALTACVGISIAHCGVLCAADKPKMQWTRFEMNHKDEAGKYLWRSDDNWRGGFPAKNRALEVGDDKSGKAVHCVLAGGKVECGGMEIAEHARTEGSSLIIKRKAEVLCYGNIVVGKDRTGYLTIEGTVRMLNKHSIFECGGPWGVPGNPSKGVIVITSTGLVDAYYVGINKGRHGPDDPANKRARGSSITVDGGTLKLSRGMRISTSDPTDPGKLILRKRATFKQTGGVIEIWAGIWQIDGGEVTVSVNDLVCDGTKFFKDGAAIIKLTGAGVSTIKTQSIDLKDNTWLDVSGLTVKPGRYTLMEYQTLKSNRLALIKGTDSNQWALELDAKHSKLILIRKK